MSILKVARMGHPVLRAKARPLEKAEIRSAVVQQLIDDMLDTMAEYHGVGRVPRSRQIAVKAYDRRGKRIEVKAGGFTARVIQHETDHLDGVLFFDRMTSLASMTFLDEYSRYWRKTDD